MKSIRKISTLILALTLVFTLMAFAVSCGEETPDDPSDPPAGETGTDYTVTVKDSDGNAVEGAKLIIAYRGGSSEELTTGADGKASATLEASGRLTAEITSVPAGYIKPTSKTTFDENATTATVTLELDKRVAHTVTVKDSDGNAVVGVNVLICQSVCQMPVATDENGVAVVTFEPEASYIKVKIDSADYTLVGELDADGYLHFDEGTTEVTLTVTKNA